MNSKYKKSNTLKMKDKDVESTNNKLDEKSISVHTVQLQKSSNFYTNISNNLLNTEMNIEIIPNDKRNKRLQETASPEKVRKDFKGIPIMKGKGKKHHITFRDFTGRYGLVEYVNIAKIKEEEFEEETVSGKKKKSLNNDESVSCACLIF